MLRRGDYPFTRRVSASYRLTDQQKQLLNALHVPFQGIPPRQLLTEAGEVAPGFLVVDGWAYSYRLLRDGRRQIVQFYLPGDVVNPYAFFGLRTPCATRSLTSISCASLDEGVWDRLGRGSPELSRWLCWHFGERTVNHEHVLSLGRRSAYERMVHLLLAFWHRLSVVGKTEEWSYKFPAKQEHLADHLGLSIVHVSRTLTELRKDGLLRIERGTVYLDQPRRLAEVGDFSPDAYSPAPPEGETSESRLGSVA